MDRLSADSIAAPGTRFRTRSRTGHRPTLMDGERLLQPGCRWAKELGISDKVFTRDSFVYATFVNATFIRIYCYT